MTNTPDIHLPASFDAMKPEEFENYLPDLFASSPNGKISDDPRIAKFLAANPDCAALVRDLETIAEHARSLFEPVSEPADHVWSNIQSKLRDEPVLEGIEADSTATKATWQ